MAKLRHGGIAQVFHLAADSPEPHLVLEHLEASLSEYIAEGKQLPVGQVVRAMGQLNDALEAAAAAGELHHRLVPSCVFLDADHDIKITDFGRGRLHLPTDLLAPEAACLAPEIRERRPADARADLFSVGVIAFGLLTGHLPVVESGFLTRAPRADRFREDLPAGLVDLLAHLLAVRPKKRVASCAELRRGLNALGLAAPARARRSNVAQRAATDLAVEVPEMEREDLEAAPGFFVS